MTSARTNSFMLIAGEPSGDRLAADLVTALQSNPALRNRPFPPGFFGAGGPQMKESGVEVCVDLTRHAVFGLTDVLRQYSTFRRIFNQLLRLARSRQPETIILVDFGGMNRRFANAIRQIARSRAGEFRNWNPKLVYYVSPQVWASRASRARQIASDVDLLLSIFPFEKDWYQKRVPHLKVEFVGNPLIDRYAELLSMPNDGKTKPESGLAPLILLLPGSRMRELEAHLPILLDSAAIMSAQTRIRTRVVLPNAELAEWARQRTPLSDDLEIQSGLIADSLREADLALACSGTVTLECACLKVPAVVIYKTSWITYEIARRIIKVESIAMPNIILNERVYPEFIQRDATPERISKEALDILTDPLRKERMKTQLTKVVQLMGKPGASRRAAQAIVDLCSVPSSRLP